MESSLFSWIGLLLNWLTHSANESFLNDFAA